MRAPITDPTHLKNKILLSCYIFRSLPYLYLEQTTTSTKERRVISKMVANLEVTKYLSKKTALHSLSFLYLTKKGYDFITTQLLKREGGVGYSQPYYAYRSYRSLRGTVSEHQYMNFLYIWHLISTNASLLSRDIEIYEDSNLNHCRLIFSHGGRDIVLSPDVLVFYPSPDSTNNLYRRVIMVENDTGGESYKTLFAKLVEYATLIMHLKSLKIDGGELCFVFHSKERAEKLLFSDAGLSQFVKEYNDTVKVKGVHSYEILSAYLNSEIQVNYAILTKDNKTTPYEFKPYDFAKVLLTRYPKWEKYLRLKTTNYRLTNTEKQ